MKKSRRWWIYIILVFLIVNLVLNSPYLMEPSITSTNCPCYGTTDVLPCNTIIRTQMITILIFTLEIRCRGTEYISCLSGAIRETNYKMDKGCAFDFYFFNKKLVYP